MRKIVFLALICASMSSCEKGDYGSPNYNNSTGPNNNNNNNRPVSTVTVNPPSIDTSWYYRMFVNTWMSVKNFYLHDDFVFKMKEDVTAGVYAMKPMHTSDVLRFPYKVKRITVEDRLSIPADEYSSGNFRIEMSWDGNSTGILRYRCLVPFAVDHNGNLYVTQDQSVSFSLRYTGKNTNDLPLYSINFNSGLRLDITFDPLSSSVQRYLDLTQWNGGYTLYKEADGSLNLAQLGSNTPAIFFAPL